MKKARKVIPAHTPKRKGVRATIFLPDEVAAKVRQIAREDDRSFSYVLRKAVEQFAAKRKSRKR